MADDRFDVEAALDEVTQKTEQDVERETAYKWASRAIACYLLYQRTAKVDWLLQGDNYRHEAIEHAALVKEEEGSVYRDVLRRMEEYRNPRKEIAAPTVPRREAYRENQRKNRQLAEMEKQNTALRQRMVEVDRERDVMVESIKREAAENAATSISGIQQAAAARIAEIERECREREDKILEAATRPINVPPSVINVAPAEVNVAPPNVEVHPPAVHVDAPQINVAPAEVKVDVHLPKRQDLKVDYDTSGRITGLTPVEP